MADLVFGWASSIARMERVAPSATRRDGEGFHAYLARRVGVSEGQIEGILDRKVKEPKFSVGQSIRSFFMARLEHEIARLNDELELARQSGVACDDRAIEAARRHVRAMEEALASGAPR